MAATIQICNMLDVMAGPGMLPSRGCTKANLFVISGTVARVFPAHRHPLVLPWVTRATLRAAAVIAGMLALLHTFWGVIAFGGFESVVPSLGRTARTPAPALHLAGFAAACSKRCVKASPSSPTGRSSLWSWRTWALPCW
jgi:hypothetical protein